MILILFPDLFVQRTLNICIYKGNTADSYVSSFPWGNLCELFFQFLVSAVGHHKTVSLGQPCGKDSGFGVLSASV